MEIGKTIYVPERKQWRDWLSKNHSSAPDIWLVQYKKKTRKPSIPYADAVEEALCFGWIDSIEKSIDEERYALRFTPRRPRSNWSKSNEERIRRLFSEGKMTKAGLAAAADILGQGPG
ncbi:MAG: YdeI/OmpD-associated family protein [Actinomycetota bacterium]